MKFHVTDSCVGCGLCASTCPDVFHLTEAGVAEAIAGDVPAADEAGAQEALGACPAGAIEQQ